MKKDRLLVALLCCAAIAVFAAGNSWSEQLQLFKEGETVSPDGPPAVLEDTLEQAPATGREQTEDTQTADAESREVILYFTSADNGNLIGEKRDIPRSASPARSAMEQLIAGPREEDLLPSLPTDTRLLDINSAEGLCTVDLSEELINGSHGSEAQLTAIYSIINTMSQFDTVDQVQVLVEGQQLSAINGVDVSQAMTAMSF